MSQNVGGLAVVDHGGRHQAQTRVVVLVVVPGKERLAEATGIFDGAETIREVGAVFQGAEVTFRIRIVIANMRPAVGLEHTQVRQQQGHGFRFHG